MFSVRPIRRPAVLTALVCALIVSAMSGAAAARPSDQVSAPARAASAHAHRVVDLRMPDTRDVGQPVHHSGPVAQERYYSSYGDPAPLTLPRPSAPSNETPWLSIGLSIAIALAIVAATATRLHRLRIRRRGARATT